MLVLTNETSFVLKMMGACRYPGLAADVGLNVTEAPFMVGLPKWVGRVGSSCDGELQVQRAHVPCELRVAQAVATA